ncbi:MAG TPA: TfuA-like protein [Stellaceae bacterium]|nr:TfuA-like protein [Stellaceae bacterium]
MSAIIFAGPSLPPSMRPTSEPGIEWRPPVRQGELYRAALAGPAAIGVIDGYFEVVPTVWHKEILWAMAQGIHVFGAASIGALRAAELDVFGMRGIGHIYEAYRDGVLEDDDEVAVSHGPEELGYPPLTEAMVNIRATLAEAERGGILAPDLAEHLTEIAKAMFYKERSYEAMLKAAADRGLPAASLRRFAEWLPSGRLDRKRIDAEAMLAAIRAHLAADIPPLRVCYTLAETVAWQTARTGVGAKSNRRSE